MTASIQPLAHADKAYELLVAHLGDTQTAHATLCIHTARVSLELDANGICQDVYTLDGSEPEDIERCIGAQYVASVDAQGVSAAPSVGGHALFVERLGESPLLVLKTAAITAVVYRDDVVAQ